MPLTPTLPLTYTVFLWSYLTLSSHKSLSHPQPGDQLLGCPYHTSCGPPPPTPYCSLPHHSQGRFVSLGLATVSCWEQELHRGPWPFPGSSRGMEGNVSSSRPVCPAWTPAFSHFTALSLHPHSPMRKGSNKIRITDTSPAPPVPFIVTMFTHHPNRVLNVPLRFLDMGRSRGWGKGQAV